MQLDVIVEGMEEDLHDVQQGPVTRIGPVMTLFLIYVEKGLASTSSRVRG